MPSYVQSGLQNASYALDVTHRWVNNVAVGTYDAVSSVAARTGPAVSAAPNAISYALSSIRNNVIFARVLSWLAATNAAISSLWQPIIARMPFLGAITASIGKGLTALGPALGTIVQTVLLVGGSILAIPYTVAGVAGAVRFVVSLPYELVAQTWEKVTNYLDAMYDATVGLWHGYRDALRDLWADDGEFSALGALVMSVVNTAIYPLISIAVSLLNTLVLVTINPLQVAAGSVANAYAQAQEMFYEVLDWEPFQAIRTPVFAVFGAPEPTVYDRVANLSRQVRDNRNISDRAHARMDQAFRYYDEAIERIDGTNAEHDREIRAIGEGVGEIAEEQGTTRERVNEIEDAQGATAARVRQIEEILPPEARAQLRAFRMTPQHPMPPVVAAAAPGPQQAAVPLAAPRAQAQS